MLKSKDKTELDVPQREYRNMEINRRDFAEETTLILRKQNQTLEKLRKENETLKEEYVSLQARTTLKPISSFEQNQTDKHFYAYCIILDLLKRKLMKFFRDIRSAWLKKIT